MDDKRYLGLILRNDTTGQELLQQFGSKTCWRKHGFGLTEPARRLMISVSTSLPAKLQEPLHEWHFFSASGFMCFPACCNFQNAVLCFFCFLPRVHRIVRA